MFGGPAHGGQNSSVTPTELGLCGTAEGRESGGINTETAYLGGGGGLRGLGHIG